MKDSSFFSLLLGRKLSSLQLYFLFFLQLFVFFTLARFAFWIHILPSLADAHTADILKGFYIGWRFDARLAALVTFPLALLLLIPFCARRLARWRKKIFWLYFFVFFIIWSIYAIDWHFYNYLGRRLDATVIGLLEDFTTAILMVWQGYAVLPIILAILFLAVICALSFRFSAGISLRPCATRTGRFCSFLAGFFLFAWAVFGQISSNWFPLRWSKAYFSSHKAVTALGLNPVQNLYDSWRNRHGSFNREAVEKGYAVVADFLGVEHPDAKNLDYSRYCQPVFHPEGTPPNIVIIIMESMDWRKTSFAPGKGDPTPFLQELASQSVFYPHFYANARTTARAVFGTLTGIPDVNERGTASRNTRVVDQHLIAAQFKGYDKMYLLGGNTAWANIRGVIANNIPGVEILEEGFWKSPNTDVWGVADLDLFQEANEVFANRKKPFLAVIQTASFHSPYTVPPTPGFSLKALNEEDQKNYGFINAKEYNSLRYFDFALSRFFQKAKKESYYGNTIFILFGDHGITGDTANIDAAYRAADLGPWHVPLLIHAPGRIAPKTVSLPASQVDIFPTAASLVGQAYENRTLGRDLFDPRFDRNRAAMISGDARDALRFIQDGYCYVDNRHGLHALYRLGDEKGENLAKKERERFEQMKTQAQALFETSHYLLYNNAKDPKTGM